MISWMNFTKKLCGVASLLSRRVLRKEANTPAVAHFSSLKNKIPITKFTKLQTTPAPVTLEEKPAASASTPVSEDPDTREFDFLPDELKQKVVTIVEKHRKELKEYETLISKPLQADTLRLAIEECDTFQQDPVLKDQALKSCEEVVSRLNQMRSRLKGLLSIDNYRLEGMVGLEQQEAVKDIVIALKQLVQEPWRKGDVNHWKVNHNAAEFAKQLRDTPEIDIGAGVRMIQLTKFLQTQDSQNLPQFSRPWSRQLIQALFKNMLLGPRHDAIIFGTPGVGKSRSLALVLRMALKLNLRVVFESRKDLAIYAFIPSSDGQIAAYSCEKSNFKYSECTLLCDMNTIYLVDPFKPDSMPGCLANTVLASSPNPDHFKEFEKQRGAKRYTMNPWSLEELIAVKDYISTACPKLTVEEVAARYRVFGGVPRHIFSNEYETNKDIMMTAAQIFAEDSTKSTVIAAILKGGDVLQAQDKESSKLPSTLFHYVADTPTAKWRCVPGSNHIATQVGLHFWKKLMNSFSADSLAYAKNATAMGNFFEAVAGLIITEGGEFKVKELTGGDGTVSKLKLPSGKKQTTTTWEAMVKQLSSLPLDQRVVLFPEAHNQPVIDAADLPTRGYQFTISLSHPINYAEMNRIVEATGCTAENPFHLVFVVPHEHFNRFKKQVFQSKPADKMEGNEGKSEDTSAQDQQKNQSAQIRQSANKKDLTADTRTKVKQFALAIEADLPKSLQELIKPNKEKI